MSSDCKRHFECLPNVCRSKSIPLLAVDFLLLFNHEESEEEEEDQENDDEDDDDDDCGDDAKKENKVGE